MTEQLTAEAPDVLRRPCRRMRAQESSAVFKRVGQFAREDNADKLGKVKAEDLRTRFGGNGSASHLGRTAIVVQVQYTTAAEATGRRQKNYLRVFL